MEKSLSVIILKSQDEISIMQDGGRILGDLLDEVILCKIEEGVSTQDIDREIEKYIVNSGAVPVLKGYSVDGLLYEYSSCISINEEVVHAPPSGRMLRRGDLVSLDVSLRYKGFCLDAARSFVVGSGSDLVLSLIETAKASFEAGLSRFLVGKRIGDVSNAVQTCIESRGFRVIKDFCGHGIGRSLHEEPAVMNYGSKGLGVIIEEGMTIALEPMLSERDEWTSVSEDGWTAVTRSHSLACHYENTVVALKSGPKVLTRRESV